jgi:hypothetical protein
MVDHEEPMPMWLTVSFAASVVAMLALMVSILLDAPPVSDHAPQMWR